jgi:hypothetical protein
VPTAIHDPVMIGQAWDGFASPRTLGAHPPPLIHVYVNDVDALHERAKTAGADVTDLESRRPGIVASRRRIPRVKSGSSRSASQTPPQRTDSRYSQPQPSPSASRRKTSGPTTLTVPVYLGPFPLPPMQS